MINRHRTHATEPLIEANTATPTIERLALTFRLPTDAAWLAMRTPARATQVLTLATGWTLASITEIEDVSRTINTRTFESHRTQPHYSFAY